MVELPITALVLHQRFAAIDARERLLELLAASDPRSDRVVLATCHRVEVYFAGGVGQADALERESRGVVGEALVRMRGVEAVAHLFAVAAGLDSAVQGEPQIFRQVRATLVGARPPLDPLLRRLLERALALARSLRRASGLTRISRSVGSLAVDEVARLVDDPARSNVLVVGAGEMGKLAVRALSRRFHSIVIANRDRARAEALAATAGARAIALADVAANLDQVDAIVSAADTRGAVLSRETLAPRAARKPLVLVDIAVPRSVGAEARAVPGLIYRTVDDLDGSVALSQVETERMRAACVHAAEEFAREITARAAARAIRDLRLRAEDVRARQLARALRRLGHLNERDRRVVETLATGVMNAILHEPTVALRRSPERSADAIALFGAEAAGR